MSEYKANELARIAQEYFPEAWEINKQCSTRPLDYFSTQTLVSVLQSERMKELTEALKELTNQLKKQERTNE